MSDQQITCSDCGNVFPFSAAEQQFYAERGLASPPKRCKACRQARRASQEGGGGGGGPRGGGGGRFSRDARDRGRPPTGDPNEYRSPMSGGSYDSRPWRGGPPRGNDRGPSDRPRFGGGSDRPRGPRSGPPRQDGGGPPRTFDRGSRPPRSDQPRAEWGSRPPRSAAPPPPATSSEPAEHAERPRAAKPRPERPRYDITCAECGAQAQVPFKPLEGRQVFCQPCYRARKGTTTPPESSAQESDNGIVE